MPKIRAVLFDLDGTLRDTREIIYVALEDTIEEHNGRKPTREELKPHIHHHSAAHKALSSHIEYEPWLKTYRGNLGEGWMDAPFYEGALALLQSLKSMGYRLGVVTSAEYERTKDYLHYRGLGDYFEVLAAVREGVRPKPEPDLIHDALGQLDCAPKDALMIGDMATDVMAANTAGVRALGVTHGFATRAELEEAGADYVVDSLPELLEYIRETYGENA